MSALAPKHTARGPSPEAEWRAKESEIRAPGILVGLAMDPASGLTWRQRVDACSSILDALEDDEQLDEVVPLIAALTVQDVRAELSAIRHAADLGDNGEAHSLEDFLHRTVLRAVSSGHPAAPELAMEALRSRGISFRRRFS